MFKIFSRVTPPHLKALRKNMLKETGFGLVDWNYGRRWLRESRRLSLLKNLQRNPQRNLQRNLQRKLQRNLQRNHQRNLQRNLQRNPRRNNFSLFNSIFDQCRIFNSLEMWNKKPLNQSETATILHQLLLGSVSNLFNRPAAVFCCCQIRWIFSFQLSDTRGHGPSWLEYQGISRV